MVEFEDDRVLLSAVDARVGFEVGEEVGGALEGQPPLLHSGLIDVSLFGVGAGLTLDEFALWVHLEDVYWTGEGRQSVDAVIVATLIGGLVVAGRAPFDSGDGSSITAIGSIVAINLAFVVLAVLKGRRLLAIAGAFVPLLAIVGAVRLADPASPWARRRYPDGSRKHERAQSRAERVAGRRSRVLDLIGGAPSQEG